ncbi:MAG: MucR family transcriptional regulator [Actinomycetia bacterium]|nr:MucR family transcriptional regulator [Actinomycetes bacterium]
MCCHLCGRWFTSLGSHVRAHGTTAERYRADLGLCRREPLTARHLSSAISARQRQAYATRPEVRERFAVGQQMARDGDLARLSINGRSADPPAPAALARRRRALEAGRDTVAARGEAVRAALIVQYGAPDFATYLRARYGEGASLERLAKDTGLGRDRLRVAMADAAIEIRGIGANTALGKRSRALKAEEAAARRVGADNLRAWLTERRAEGWTLSQLGTAVGHSGHWVSWRLNTDPHLGPESLDAHTVPAFVQ